MIAYVSIGVRDIGRSKRFYDAALVPLRYKYLRAARTLPGYGYGRDSIALWVVQVQRPVPADELLLYSLECCLARWDDDPRKAAGRREPRGTTYALASFGEACLAEHEAQERLAD
jgi:hypothetical protein